MNNVTRRKVSKLVRQAGALLKADFAQQSQVTAKAPKDCVTDTDQRLDAFLKEGLIKLVPDAALYSEEDESPVLKDNGWVIDPLDGTANFILGLPHCAVSVAFLEDRQVVGAWVFNPLTNEFFDTGEEGQARLNGRPIRVSQRLTVEAAYGLFGFSANYANITRYYQEWPDLFAGSRKALGALSPSLCLCAVARGKADFFVDFGASIEGKVAGAHILERAGGQLWNYDRSAYDIGRVGVVATNGLALWSKD